MISVYERTILTTNEINIQSKCLFHTQLKKNDDIEDLMSKKYSDIIMKDLEIFLSSDQPTTCPKCGNRTEIENEFDASQQHKCLSEECKFQFILEFDNENEI